MRISQIYNFAGFILHETIFMTNKEVNVYYGKKGTLRKLGSSQSFAVLGRVMRVGCTKR